MSKGITQYKGYEIRYVARPFESMGLPSALRWAVDLNQTWVDSYRTKREAKAEIDRIQLTCGYPLIRMKLR